MNTAITLIIAIVVIILHVWLCRRSPKLWYLGGIIPLLWIVLLVFLFFNDVTSVSRKRGPAFQTKSFRERAVPESALDVITILG